MAPHPVVLFDGVCNLCNRTVAFVLERDRAGVFRFASLQSPAGRALLLRAGLPLDDLRSLVLIDGDRVLTRSSAVLAIARRLSGPWRALALLRVVPRALRDLAYDRVAASRYRIFGRRDACLVPLPHLRERFLDAS